MAELDNTQWYTLTDLFKMVGPDQRAQAVAFIFMQENSMLADGVMVSANGIAWHQGSRTKQLPSSTRVGINQFVNPTKGLTEQVTDICARYKTFSMFDVEILRLHGFKNAVRSVQDKMHMRGIANDVATDFVYGNTNQDPTVFMGLATRLSDNTHADYGSQMIDSGGTGGGCTSILLVDWAEDGCHLLYPEVNGAPAGIEVKQFDNELIYDATNGFLEAEVISFTLRTGVHCPDPECIGRICNIKASTIVDGTDMGNGGLINQMIRLEELLPASPRGNRRFYANRQTISALRMIAATGTVSKAQLGWDNVMGRRVTTWNGIPVMRCDAIINTEATITFS